MGQDNTVPRRIDGVEGAAGQVIVCSGPGIVETWGAGGGGGAYAPVFIAPNNATANEKLVATASGGAILTGANDEVDINALVAAGRHLFYGSGQVVIEAPVTINANGCRFQGSGAGVTEFFLAALSDCDMIDVTGDDVEISHIKFDFNGDNQSNNNWWGIHVLAVDDFVLQNCKLVELGDGTDGSFSVIGLDGVCNNSKILDSTFKDNHPRGIDIGNESGAGCRTVLVSGCIFDRSADSLDTATDIRVIEDSTDVLIANCASYNSGYCFVYVVGDQNAVPATWGDARQVVVDGCLIVDAVDGGGLRAGYNAHDVTFSNNVFRHGDAENDIIIEGAHNINIIGNISYQAYAWFLSIEGGFLGGNDYPAYNINVIGNIVMDPARGQVDNNEGFCLLVVQEDEVHNVSICNNIVDDSNEAIPRFIGWATDEEPTNNILIQDNIIGGIGYRAIDVVNSGINIVIRGNSITVPAGGFGVSISSGTGLIVEHNTFTGFTVNQPIRVWGGPATEVIIRDNDWSQAATQSIISDWTDVKESQFRRNIGVNGYTFLGPGEKETVCVALAAGAQNAYMFNWRNEHAQGLIIDYLQVDITTGSTTAGGEILDVGVAANPSVNSDNIFDSLDLTAVQLHDSRSVVDCGTNGMSRAAVGLRSVLMDARAGANDYITGQITVAACAGIAGWVYIHYTGRHM